MSKVNVTKVEPMAYMWLLWCTTCATFCAYIGFKFFFHFTFWDVFHFLMMEAAVFLWIYMGLNPWIPDKEE